MTTDHTGTDVGHAFSLASHLHASQVDLVGDAAILHPVRVALALKAAGHSNTHQIIGVLHDVIEDAGYSWRAILDAYGEQVAASVVVLTRHTDKESYADYIERVKLDPIGSVVKVFDIRDNYARLLALSKVDREKAVSLQGRYNKALAALGQTHAARADDESRGPVH